MGLPRSLSDATMSRALGEAFQEGSVRWYASSRWEEGIPIPIHSPWGRTRIALVETPRPRRILEAIESLYHAWDELASMPTDELVDAIREIGEEMLARADDLATILSMEAGMGLEEAADEVVRAADVVEHIAGLEASTRPQRGFTMTLSPYTSPLATVATGLAYSLVNRLPVVIKLPMRAPISGMALADIANEVGLGQHVAFIPAPAARAVPYIASHDALVAVVSYSSRLTAGVLRRLSSTGNLLTNTMGREAAVVLGDADVRSAAGWIAASIARHSGQACGSTVWVIAERSVEEEIVDALIKRLEDVEPAPLASRALLVRAKRIVDDAIEKGAQLHGEWSPSLGEPIKPVVLSRVSKASEAFYSDVRAPVVFISRASDPVEAAKAASALRRIATRLNVYTDSIRALRQVDELAGFNITSVNRSEEEPAHLDPCIAPGVLPDDPSSMWRPLPRRAALSGTG